MKDKKKIIYPIVLLVLIGLTVYAVISQSASFTAEGFAEYVAGAKPGWLAGAAGCMLLNILAEGLALLVLCRAAGCPQRLRSGVMYSAADLYFSAITPSSTGGQPASALLMVRDGIPAVTATVVLLVNLALYAASTLTVSAVSFILRPSALNCFNTTSKVLILTGLGVQAVLFTGIVLLIFNPRAFSAIVNIFWRAGQKLRILRNMDDRRARLEKMENDYRMCGELMRGNIGSVLGAFALNLVQRTALIAVTPLVYMATGGSLHRVVDAFCVQMMVAVGAYCIPLPGSVGVSDYMALDGLKSFAADPVNLELLARSISFYACILLCALALAVSYILHKKHNRRQEK